MRVVLKEKLGKFGSLLGLTAICAMLLIFSLVLPEFLVSTIGRAFAIVWSLVAIIVFISYTQRMTVRDYAVVLRQNQRKTERGRKSGRSIMRG